MMNHESARPVRLLLVGLLVLSTVASARSAGAAPDVVSQFEGLSNNDNEEQRMPPDPTLAVGSDHVFEMVNVSGRITANSEPAAGDSRSTRPVRRAPFSASTVKLARCPGAIPAVCASL